MRATRTPWNAGSGRTDAPRYFTMMDDLFNTDELMAVLRDLADDVRRGYAESLESHDRRASGALIDTLRTTIEVRGTTYTVWLHLEDYWKYVEYDTKPHWPPRDAILRWIKIKPIIPRPDSRGRIPTPQTLAFLIGRAMAGKSPNQPYLKNPKGGTTGTHDLQRTLDAVLPAYEERLLEALQRDTLAYLEKVMP